MTALVSASPRGDCIAVRMQVYKFFKKEDLQRLGVGGTWHPEDATAVLGIGKTSGGTRARACSWARRR